jgi:ribulose-phosphate 3-epimerase
MCSDFDNLKREVKELDLAGADIFHIDIMDGNFVPNFGMGLQDIKTIRQNTEKLVDVHLMISNPVDYVEMFADLGADIIYIHPESDIQTTRTLEKIKNKGKKVGIAINPGTSISQVEELLTLTDYMMVMTVNPGFSGQKYLSFVDEKIEKLIHLKDKYNYKILIDGAVSEDVMKNLSTRGVDGFVLGTSSLFGKQKSYKELFNSFKKIER